MSILFALKIPPPYAGTAQNPNRAKGLPGEALMNDVPTVRKTQKTRRPNLGYHPNINPNE